MRRLDVDVLVIGAGVAGLVAALDILDLEPDATVAVLDKGRPTGDGGGSTPLAQGGLAAAMGAEDSPDLHAADTIRAGDGLCDPRAVAVVTQEGPQRVLDLITRGAVFDRSGGPDGPLALAREGGQSVGRGVRAADATGAEIARALRAAASGRVRRLQGVAVRLALSGRLQGVAGAHAVLDATDATPFGPAQVGGPVLVAARATVLATGGCGGLFAATTNSDGATADGVALAYRAGAQLVDLEFVQFHPTGLRPRDESVHQRFLLTEALRGAGATLVDARGERFMPDRHPDAELAPRYVVTKAILDQPGGAWLDATGIPEDQLLDEFPTVLAGARRAGYDLRTDPVPVQPCQHYMVGGVATDLWGRTSVDGLWAAGEVASTGVHGANRMAGNSLLQASVFGHRVAWDAAATLGHAQTREPVDDLGPSARSGGDDDPWTIRHAIRDTMTAGCGAVRTAAALGETARRLADLRGRLGDGPFLDRVTAEADAALTVAALMTDAARIRTESRGVHWRDDHPGHEPAWEGRHVRVESPVELPPSPISGPHRHSGPH